MIYVTEREDHTELKNFFLENLFEKRKKDKDYVFVCTNESLSKFFYKQYHKYPKKHSEREFMYECILLTYEAIRKFEIRDNGSWIGIVNDTDKPNIGRLITNIKKTVENKIIEFVNDDCKFTKDEVDGKKGQHVIKKVKKSSLDDLLIGAEGEEITLINTIKSEQGFWTEKDQYNLTFFMKWFKEHRERILTKSQQNFLDKLAQCQHERGLNSYTVDDMYEVTGVPSCKRNTKLNRIRERVYKVWKQEVMKSQLQMQKEAELELWTGLMDLIYSENSDISSQNTDISNWIITHLDDSRVSNLVYDHLTGPESQKVTFSYNSPGVSVDSKILYKIVDRVEKRIDQLLQLDTDPVEFYKKPEEMKRWTPEAHIRYHKYHEGFRKQDCYVFDLDGLLVRTEAWTALQKKQANIMEYVPTGMSYLKKMLETDQYEQSS